MVFSRLEKKLSGFGSCALMSEIRFFSPAGKLQTESEGKMTFPLYQGPIIKQEVMAHKNEKKECAGFIENVEHISPQ